MERRFGGKIGILGLAAFLLFMVAMSSVKLVDSGERAIVLKLGKYVYTMDEGLNFKMPLIEKAITFDIREKAYKLETEVSYSDIQTIKLHVNLIYRLDANKLGDIYKTYAENYERILIAPTFSEVVNSVVGKYPIESFIEKRDEISRKILEETKRLIPLEKGFVLQNAMIPFHDFSDEFNNAIEAKKVAEQKSLQAKYELEKVKLEAEAQRQKQSSLSPMVLQELAIQKWDGKLPQYFGGGQLPFIINR